MSGPWWGPKKASQVGIRRKCPRENRTRLSGQQYFVSESEFWEKLIEIKRRNRPRSITELLSNACDYSLLKNSTYHQVIISALRNIKGTYDQNDDHTRWRVSLQYCAIIPSLIVQ